MSLQAPIKLTKLQQALHAKAKEAYRAADSHATARLRRFTQAAPTAGSRGGHDFLTRSSMTFWGCNGCRCARVSFLGQRHETSSERRMREIRTSGVTSADWKRGYGLE